MAIFQRSRNTVLAQLSAIRAEVDRELACKLPNYRKIQHWECRFVEVSQELAEMEIRDWRKLQPLSFYF